MSFIQNISIRMALIVGISPSNMRDILIICMIGICTSLMKSIMMIM